MIDHGQLEQQVRSARRILVVAPHPDDETLGCGGLIAAAVARGSRVHTLFVTDGGASHPPSPAWPRPRLAMAREREAEEALRLLGAGEQPRTFLRLPDAAMPATGSEEWTSARDRIADLIREFDPDLVVLPWRRDPHCDHRDSHTLVCEGLRAAGCAAPCLEYAIWLEKFGAPEDFPRDGEVEVVSLSIATQRSKKIEALMAHSTQLGAIEAEAPGGFVLDPETQARLTGPVESYFRPCM